LLVDLDIGGNVLFPNDLYQIARTDQHVVLNGAYAIDPTPAELNQLVNTPNALGVDVEGRLCRIPGGPQQTFRFAGADTGGADNVKWVQGYFSLIGDQTNGVGGPGATTQLPGCHFLFEWTNDNDNDNDKVYLDGPAGDYSWPVSSVLGANGTPIGGSSTDNLNCVIHANLSNAHRMNNILTVELVVEFKGALLSDLPLRVYASIVNRQNGISEEEVYEGETLLGITQWPYFGWWKTQ
jgi:hypothetical protein